MSIGERLTYFRKRKNMTQQDLSEITKKYDSTRFI